MQSMGKKVMVVAGNRSRGWRNEDAHPLEMAHQLPLLGPTPINVRRLMHRGRGAQRGGGSEFGSPLHLFKPMEQGGREGPLGGD